MHNDTNKLKELAERATPGPWVSTESAESDHERWVMTADQQWSICATHSGAEGADCEQDNAEFIAAANPAAVLALIAEVERLRTRLEISDKHPYDGIYCRDETIKGLDEKCDRLKAENEVLRKDAERYQALRQKDRGGVVVRDRNSHLFGENLDAAIDAALEGGGR